MTSGRVRLYFNHEVSISHAGCDMLSMGASDYQEASQRAMQCPIIFLMRPTSNITAGWSPSTCFSTDVGLYVHWSLQASISDIPSSLSLWALLFHRTLHVKFMASTLQQDIPGILLNDYTTRMFVNLGAARSLTLLFSLVVILTAVGYDYSK